MSSYTYLLDGDCNESSSTLKIMIAMIWAGPTVAGSSL